GEDTRLAEYTDVLLKEVDRVNRIIEMLLDISRPVTPRLVPLNLHQLLERVALLAEEMASQRGVQILRRYDPSLPPILADEDRILQVFHNLVRNAVEAMDLGHGQRSMAEIQVMDDGQGIPEAIRSRLFTPFFTTKDKGLGLGLALCHRIIDEHRGAIQ